MIKFTNITPETDTLLEVFELPAFMAKIKTASDLQRGKIDGFARNSWIISMPPTAKILSVNLRRNPGANSDVPMVMAEFTTGQMFFSAYSTAKAIPTGAFYLDVSYIEADDGTVVKTKGLVQSEEEVFLMPNNWGSIYKSYLCSMPNIPAQATIQTTVQVDKDFFVLGGMAIRGPGGLSPLKFTAVRKIGEILIVDATNPFSTTISAGSVIYQITGLVLRGQDGN